MKFDVCAHSPSRWGATMPRGLGRVIKGALALALGATLGWAHADSVTYPRPESGSSVFNGYYWQLLGAALRATEKDFGPMQAQPSDAVMNHRRAMEELVAGSVQVYVRAVLPQAYADLLDLVPFPLDKGLLGYRIFLIHKDSQAKLATVRSLKDLQAFTFGQGATWSDTEVLTQAQLNVLKSTSYEGLFSMLLNKRFDLFPRGVDEVLAEYEQRRAAEPDLAIEDSLVLAYPQSFYFMVKKDPQGDRLKQRLLTGLQRMRADGSFEKMYQAFKTAALSGLKLRERRVIRIDNPNYAAPVYLLGQKDYWDNLSEEFKK